MIDKRAVYESIILPFFEKFNHEELAYSQLDIFCQKAASRNYNFQSRYIQDFVEDQIRRGVSADFYRNFKGTFLNENYKVNEENKIILEQIKLYKRYLMGLKRIKEFKEGENGVQ